MIDVVFVMHVEFKGLAESLRLSRPGKLPAILPVGEWVTFAHDLCETEITGYEYDATVGVLYVVVQEIAAEERLSNLAWLVRDVRVRMQHGGFRADKHKTLIPFLRSTGANFHDRDDMADDGSDLVTQLERWMRKKQKA